MAIPAAVGGWGGGTVKLTGIKLALFPSTSRGIGIELQQSTGSTLASSQWTSVFMPPSTRAGSLQYTANLPLSTKRFYFRARHSASGGFSAGPFTPTVNARPVVIPDYSSPITVNSMGNVEVPGADILISSGNKPKVGSQNTTSYKPKDLIIPFSELAPANNNSKWAFSSAYVHPNSTGGSTLYAPVVLPLSAVITTLGARLYKNGAPDTVTVELLRLNTTGGVTTLRQHIYSAGSSFLTLSTGITPETVTSTKHYVLRVTFGNTAAGANERFYWYKLTYRMPNYDIAY